MAQPEEQQQSSPEQQQAPPAAPQQDCMQCRVIGAGVCFAASAYLTASNYAVPPSGRVHRAVMLAAAGGFAAMGLARALV